MKRILRILGTRGVPAAHGGFETFAEYLALYLIARGWRVVVYCQIDGDGDVSYDAWEGVECVKIPVDRPGAAGTMIFDWMAIRHVCNLPSTERGLCLTLGYNTAAFCALLRVYGVPNIINMDGIEWSRAKWGRIAKTWFWLNDWAGSLIGNHLVADHPAIADHLATRVSRSKITTIPYGAERLQGVDERAVRDLNLNPGKFLTVIARPEPENSVLDVVLGYSMKPRPFGLVILGNYDKANSFHRAVLDSAGPGVRFLGAIYDKRMVQALRYHSMAYVHGHQVGGTNPSLVEALGAGNAVIAHDNRFNRWVAGDSALYFDGAREFSDRLEQIANDPEILLQMRSASSTRFSAGLTWPQVLGQYEKLLDEWSATQAA
ncbi:DUF1972 domain-containing protein [Aquincola sp. MAHUQ-54]|uniref:DUF1972 domain-containing protein n=1 Tax=Aquincola agrisoli TaxID=3119538 RepID=A0AAW9QLN1_9BURK